MATRPPGFLPTVAWLVQAVKNVAFLRHAEHKCSGEWQAETRKTTSSSFCRQQKETHQQNEKECKLDMVPSH